jgi:chaperonin GroES
LSTLAHQHTELSKHEPEAAGRPHRGQAQRSRADNCVRPRDPRHRQGEAAAGQVIAVGPGRWSDDKGAHSPLDIKEGDTVLYSKYGGTEVTVDGDDLLILTSRDVLAIVTK